MDNYGGKYIGGGQMFQDIRNIYHHIGDEESKSIYVNRLLFSLTGDRRYMTDIIKNTALYQNICGIMAKDERKKYIAGAGQWGQVIVDLFYEDGLSGIIDNNKKGSYHSVPIISIQEFAEYAGDASVYIASTSFHDEFCRMLDKAGVGKERIVDITGMMLEVYRNEQYFDLPYLADQKQEHEVFIDGGCYDAANTAQFVRWAEGSRKTVYAFEPDGQNAEKCVHVLEEMKDLSYRLLHKGLWSGRTVLKFCSKANEASNFMQGGDLQIPVTSLDLEIDEKVTFIKLDVEGAEYEALKGAECIIRKYKPKLAISVYHKWEDIWELPKLILSYCPEYTFYLRHYSLSSEETVLYAL